MMKKFKKIKFVLGISLILSATTHVYTASDTEEIKEESEEKKEIAIPLKPVRTKFGFDKLPEGTEQPWRLIRGLQRLQDRIVQGKPRAQDAYKLLLQHLAKVLNDQDDSVWNHERNLDAITVYLLLGGKTELGYKALQKTNLDNLQKQPLEAAMAYAEQDLDKAYELMLELDHLALPPSMSAQFALAKSMVMSSTNLDQALIYLREARRLAPGTLIEEGAIRRSIRIAGETREIDDFFQLSSGYMRRFRNSHYFNDFLRNFGYSLVRMPRKKEAELLKFLQEVLSKVDDTQQIAVAAYVARHAAISGRRKLSLWASNMALEKLAEGSVIYERMKLYLASSEIVTQEKSQSAMLTLEKIPPEKLDRIDQQILAAAKILGQQILQDSVDSMQEDDITKLASTMSEPVAEQEENADVNKNQYVQRATILLASSQSALKKVAP